MQVRAYAKNIRISPQKARLVTNLIYGLPATEALRTLQFTQKKAARIIENVVKSAIANAKVQGIAKDDLKILKAVADEGMRLNVLSRMRVVALAIELTATVTSP